MENIITVKGVVRGRRTIEVHSEKLVDWLDEEVTLTIKRRKNVKAVMEMLNEMREGSDVGYERTERSSLYRV